jgi:hypothetical protein
VTCKRMGHVEVAPAAGHPDAVEAQHNNCFTLYI